MTMRTMSEALALREQGVCVICGANSNGVGETKSKLDPTRSFELMRCPACAFAFVKTPRVDFENLYDDAYYRGEGADPLVAYSTDLLPKSVRKSEWKGIASIVTDLVGHKPRRWLDYGCGYGGLVQFVQSGGFATEAIGFDYGHPIEHAAAQGIETLVSEDLDAVEATFDVVTAIEVLEHTIDPLDTLQSIAQLLRPGGVLFLTTGNAAKHRSNLAGWPYVIPDIHVSFFEPQTLTHAYNMVGLTALDVGWSRGMRDVIKYKVLKTLRQNEDNVVHRCVPWSIVGRLADFKEGVSRQPAAQRPAATKSRARN
jgi:2-polyprenyl-3-methyl-5-hydroxy-6-metoxy-1,4-benzoquinol methylase